MSWHLPTWMSLVWPFQIMISVGMHGIVSGVVVAAILARYILGVPRKGPREYLGLPQKRIRQSSPQSIFCTTI